MLVVSRQAEVLRGLYLPPNERGILQYIPPQVLERIPFYSATPSQGAYYTARQMFDQHDIQPTATMEVINTSTAYHLAPGNGGFALAPVAVSCDEKFTPEPIFCSIRDKPVVRTAGIFYRGDVELSESAQFFCKVATREVSQYVNNRIPKFRVHHDIDFSSLK